MLDVPDTGSCTIAFGHVLWYKHSGKDYFVLPILICLIIWCLGPFWPRPTPPFQKKWLFCISAAACKTIHQTWLDPERPTLYIFLKNVHFCVWTGSMHCLAKRWKLFFDTWKPIIQIVPPHIQSRIHDCFRYTTWYLARSIMWEVLDHSDTTLDTWFEL